MCLLSWMTSLPSSWVVLRLRDGLKDHCLEVGASVSDCVGWEDPLSPGPLARSFAAASDEHPSSLQQSLFFGREHLINLRTSWLPPPE